MTPGKQPQRQQGRRALDLIEEATHLLRTAAPATLAVYFLGTIPFVLGLLFFWADMSRSPLAPQHLAAGSLGMTALFFWMKFWQVSYARRLRAQAANEPLAPLAPRACARIFFHQAVIQPFGLLLREPDPWPKTPAGRPCFGPARIRWWSRSCWPLPSAFFSTG